MKNMSSKEFEQRWRSAQNGPRKVMSKAKGRGVEISLETILDRYMSVIDQAQAEHLVDKHTCDEICKATHALKDSLKKVDDKKIAHIKKKKVLA